jgi:hypothetical protein
MRTTGINWKRGALRLWIVASALWCAVVFAVALVSTTNETSFLPADSPATVHVRISNTETWDYPAEWGVPRIRDDLKRKRKIALMISHINATAG